MKNIYFRIFCVALFMIGTVIIEIGCNPIIPPSISSSGLLRGASMALSVDATTLKPLETTDVFKKDTPIIYCSVLLVNAPENTLISSYIFMIKGEGGKENSKSNSSSVEADGSCFLSFSWRRPGNAWTSGDYKVVISVNGKEDLTVPFRIE